MGKIIQCRFSKGVEFFAENFRQKWGLKDYENTQEPCYFAGMYYDEDLEALKNHKGFKVVCFTSADIPQIEKIADMNNIIVRCDEASLIELKKYAITDFRYKISHFPIKDYSDFTPEPLGDKIYVYLGYERFKDKYGYHIIKRVIDYFGEDSIIMGFQGKDINYVKQNYYRNSFINLQFNPVAGCTSATEMALMGRKSIANRPYSFCINYETINDVFNAIKHEREKIGTIQTLKSRFLVDNDDWMNLNYWDGLESTKI